MVEAMNFDLRTHVPSLTATTGSVQQHAAPTTAPQVSNAAPAAGPTEELDAVTSGFRKLNAEMCEFLAELD